MDFIVLSHFKDEDDNVYRLTVGEPAYSYQKVRDGEGAIVMEKVPVLDSNTGEPITNSQNVEVSEGVFERQDVPQYILREKEEQVVVGYDRQEEFVFHADDERWANKEPNEIADIQRQIVLTALKGREEAATIQPVDPAANAPANSLPGVGVPLA